MVPGTSIKDILKTPVYRFIVTGLISHRRSTSDIGHYARYILHSSTSLFADMESLMKTMVDLSRWNSIDSAMVLIMNWSANLFTKRHKKGLKRLLC